jgi:hypothetical protein
MRLKPFIFGAVAAVALTVPVIASGVSGTSQGSRSGPPDLGDYHDVILVAAVSSFPSSSGNGGSTNSNSTSGTFWNSQSNHDPIAVDVLPPPDVVVQPVSAAPLPPIKRPVHLARVLPVRVLPAPEQVANAIPVAFRPDHLWMIGGFR